MLSELRKQVEEAGGIDEDLFTLTDGSDQLHGQPFRSAWFDGARNGSQLFEFTDAVVGTANQWYMVTGAVVGIAAQRYGYWQGDSW